MRNCFIRSISLSLLIALFLVPLGARAQHLVLFEGFTNECDPVESGSAPLPRDAFEQNIASMLSSEGSKVIYFNHHEANECDVVQYPPSFAVASKLGLGNLILEGAVDRTTLGSGTRYSPNPSDWTSQIDADASQPSVADLSLTSIQVDTTTLGPNNFALFTDVAVTLNQAISDDLVIRYAVLQDNIQDRHNCSNCTPAYTINNVVRYLSQGDSIVFRAGSSPGTVHVQHRQELSGTFNSKLNIQWDYPTIRLIGFLEENPKGDFHVVNAATLKTGLSGIPQPPPSLYIDSKSIDGMIFNNGSGVPIRYAGATIPSLDAWYSLDNGTTWTQFEDSSRGNLGFPYSFITWYIPDTTETGAALFSDKAKVKVAIHGNNSVSALETGTFIIQRAAGVSWTRPAFGDTIKAKADSMFTLQWSKYQVDSVTIQYQVAYGGNWSAWHTIATNQIGTSYNWILPDTTAFVQVRLVPSSESGADVQIGGVLAIAKSVIPPNKGVAWTTNPAALAITSVNPNPSKSGEGMTVAYAVEKPRDISIEVLDVLGHQQWLDRFAAIESGTYNLKTDRFASGSYVLRISDGQHVTSKRIEIRK